MHETEITFDKSQPGIFGQIGPCISILIECVQTALRTQPLENATRVSTAPKGQIDIYSIRPNIKSIKALFKQYRYVIDTHTKFLKKTS